jgi:hypothetical protein
LVVERWVSITFTFGCLLGYQASEDSWYWKASCHGLEIGLKFDPVEAVARLDRRGL